MHKFSISSSKHYCPRTGKGFTFSLAPNISSKPKVSDLDPAVHPEEDVVRLEVSVDDLVLVEELDALEDLLGYRGDLFFRQNCVEDDICQGPSIHELHHHHQRVSLEKKFLIVDEIWMIQFSHHLTRGKI